jgi:oligopeptide transport system ATP-binding protein
MMASHETILSVEDLAVSFHTHEGEVEAVRGVSFTLGKGEVLAIVGESGSGKSVTVQAVMGLTATPPGEIKSGAVRFGGADLLKASDKELRRIRGNKMSMIFQDPMTSLNPSMTIGAQIREVLHQHRKMCGKKSRGRAIELLRLVGIPDPEDRLNHYPHQFSGGMRQRVMIAIAMANDPEILLADEPTTALDVTIQSQILRLIRDVRQRFGTAMVMITHDLGLVAGSADRILVMYAGRIVEEGLIDQIYYNPQPYTVGLLDAVSSLDDAGGKPLSTIEGLPPILLDPPQGCAFADRCPHRMRICRQEPPPYFHPLAANRAACWLHHEAAAAQRTTFLAARTAA